MKMRLFLVVCLAALLSACGSSDSSDPLKVFSRGADNTTILVTNNYSTSGSYSAVRTDEQDEVYKEIAPLGAVSSDNSAVYYNDKLYIINRLSYDNISVVDANDLTTVYNQFSVKDGYTSTNPQDIAFVSETKAYVVMLGSNKLFVVDPTNSGNEKTTEIDLIDYMHPDETDGLVEARNAVIVGDYLFVTLQRVDRDNYWATTWDAVIAVIQVSDNSFVDVDDTTPGVQGIVLTGKNPQYMCYDSDMGKILVSETGGYSTVDGGIETVDPLTFTAEGFIVEESATNGSAMGAFVITNGKIYAAIGAGYASPVVAEFNMDGTKVKDIFTATAYLPSLAADNLNRVIIPDRDSTTPGIHFYDTNTGVLGETVSVGLPPNSIVTF